MNRSALYGALVAMAVSASAIPAAQADGLYISTFAGLSFQGDQNNQRTQLLIAGPETIDISFDTGIFLGGAVGYSFNDVGVGGVRVELEYAYRQNDVDKVFFPGNVEQLSSRDNSSGSAMLNLVYEFNKNFDWVRPYIGAGLGIAGVESDTLYAPPSGNEGNPTVALGGKVEAKLAYQFLAGVTVPVSETWELFIEGRYYETGNPEFERIRLSDDALLARYKGEYSTWHGDVGVRFHF